MSNNELFATVDIDENGCCNFNTEQDPVEGFYNLYTEPQPAIPEGYMLEPTEQMIRNVELFIKCKGHLSHPLVRAYKGTVNGDSPELWERDYVIALCKSMLETTQKIGD